MANRRDATYLIAKQLERKTCRRRASKQACSLLSWVRAQPLNSLEVNGLYRISETLDATPHEASF